MFRRLRRAVLQFRRDLFDNVWLAGPEGASRRAVHRHHRRVAAERLGQVGSVGIDNDEVDPRKAAVLAQDIDGAVVAERRYDQPRQLAERGFVIERRCQDAAGVREEALFLFDAAAVSDVDEDPDGAANAAVAVEQGRGIFNQRHPPAIGPEHVDDDAVDLAAFDRGQAHRPCFGPERLAVFRHREGSVVDPGVLRRRERTVFQPDEFGEGAVEADGAAGGIVGDGDADGQHVEDRFDLDGAVLQIDTEFANELDRLRGHRWGPGVSACYTRRRACGARRSGALIRGRLGAVG